MKKSSRLNQERNMHRSSIIYKWKQSKTVLNKYVCGFWCERTVDGLFHWGEHYYGLWTGISARNDNLKVKCLDGFVSYKCAAFHFIRCYLMDWNRVMDYWYFCISSLGSHSDGTHSLQRFHWGASNIILNFSGWRNKLIYILKRTIMNFSFSIDEEGKLITLPAGLEVTGEAGCRTGLANLVVLLLLKKLRKMPHFKDSTRVLFPAPEWPNSLSLMRGWRVCVGRSLLDVNALMVVL